LWTFVLFVIDTITVSIRNRASIVTGDPSKSRTFVFIIGDAIFVAIRGRASMVAHQAWLTWTLIILVCNTISILIRATTSHGRPGFGWARVHVIRHSVFILVFQRWLRSFFFSKEYTQRATNDLMV